MEELIFANNHARYDGECTGISKLFCVKIFDSGTELLPMKPEKPVYIAHGWHLALADKSLINEAVQARKYGPVITHKNVLNRVFIVFIIICLIYSNRRR